MRFVDSHVHLCEYKDPRPVLLYAGRSETLLVSSGVDRDSSGRTLRLAQAHPESVRAFVGVHPSEAAKTQDLDWLAQSLEESAGLGEVGLDPKYSEVAGGSAQMKAFEAQLEAAQSVGKPVQVHSRGAERLCLDVVGGFRLKAVLWHWFQAEEMLGAVRDNGGYVSFGPALLFSKKLQRMAAALDPGQVILETDGPVAFDSLGGAAGPPLVPSVAFRLSEVWGVSFEEARARTLASSLRYLGDTEKG